MPGLADLFHRATTRAPRARRNRHACAGGHGRCQSANAGRASHTRGVPQLAGASLSRVESMVKQTHGGLRAPQQIRRRGHGAHQSGAAQRQVGLHGTAQGFIIIGLATLRHTYDPHPHPPSPVSLSPQGVPMAPEERRPREPRDKSPRPSTTCLISDHMRYHLMIPHI